ncbi:MAG: isoleucine--tRNA ligase [Actinomycetota bacterium]|nr:isoleucine--tRNA ligase [Actinomycetota bacterium]
MDYRETLNLPKTDFPMRARLPQREPEIQDWWRETDIYGKVLERTRGGEPFVLHDGPPYANGDLHLGTAFNKILKDIIIKYKSMNGYFCPYVPGWDCHGQPIEFNVEKILSQEKDGSQLDIMEVRKRCHDYAMQYVERQSRQFQRLGVRGDFDDPYLTLKPSYEAFDIRVFRDFVDKELVYRSRKPIHWCPRCVTALAEAELEYKDKTSPSIYVRFPLIGPVGGVEGASGVSLVIWTTTPWTLPANVAITLHPDMEYILLEAGEEYLVIGEPLLEKALSGMGIEEYVKKGRFRGKDLEGLEAEHPWGDWTSRVITSDFVTVEQGTGAVHTAPGHGQEDYQVGLEYHLPMKMPVDDLGRFTSEAPWFEGLFVDDANPRIINDLKERGLLLASSEVEHPYPHCWRCKGPVIFRATPQWFIAVDRDFGGGSLRERCIAAVDEVEWVPGWSNRRMMGMLESRPDWCISRQRAWGVPIPAFYCSRCGEVLLDDASLHNVEELIDGKGSDAWFMTSVEDILGDNFSCHACGCTDFLKENDILDVWFESGISHEAVLNTWEGLTWPSDMYLEGSDQHRGWFQTSMLTAVGSRGRPPYRSVLTHGFVVDGEGRKMSKLLGNVISPMDICGELGADILRLWVTAADYTVDIPASQEIFDRLVEAYRRIRNTLRFLLGNLYDFDAKSDMVERDEMEELDLWIMSRLQGTVRRCTRALEEYQLHIVYHALHNFCAVDLSSLYLDIRKDCLYTFAPRSPQRRSAQTALYHLLSTLVRMMTPIITHTAEEAWRNVKDGVEGESVQVQEWPLPDETWEDNSLEEVFETLLLIRDKVAKALEVKREEKDLGTSLEAAVKLFIPTSIAGIIAEREHFLPTWLIVSQVETMKIKGEEPIRVEVEHARGEKCSRCWNYSTSVGSSPENPDICERCLAAIRER